MASENYRRNVLFTLLTVYVLNFVDRQILTLLMEPIKQDLGLSDTQLGFMSGIAFALFYTVLGIPIARFADRSNRVNIISIAVALWSVMTVLSGMAMNFWQLVIARIGVGVGEAGCTPPALSLISDYFPKSERSRAVSIYMMGVPLGILVGFFAGGWLNEIYGWRVAFIAVGLPGIIMAVIVKLVIKEPIRGRYDTGTTGDDRTYTVKETFIFLWKKPAFRNLVVAMSLTAFVGTGVGQWQATFFIRYHGMGTGELGMWLAVVIGLTGAGSIYLGGYIAGRLGQNSEALQMRLLAFTSVLMVPCGVMWLIWPDKYISLLILGLGSVLYFLHYGPAYALIVSLVPSRMRAMATAVSLLVVNLIGTGIGPLASGFLSDLFETSFGEGSLRAAMIALYAVALIAAWYFWRVGKTIQQDLGSNDVFAPAE